MTGQHSILEGHCGWATQHLECHHGWIRQHLESHCGWATHFTCLHVYQINTVFRRPPWLGNTTFRRPSWLGNMFYFLAFLDEYSIWKATMAWQHVLFRLLRINTVFRRPLWLGNTILFRLFRIYRAF